MELSIEFRDYLYEISIKHPTRYFVLCSGTDDVALLQAINRAHNQLDYTVHRDMVSALALLEHELKLSRVDYSCGEKDGIMLIYAKAETLGGQFTYKPTILVKPLGASPLCSTKNSSCRYQSVAAEVQPYLTIKGENKEGGKHKDVSVVESLLNRRRNTNG